MSSKRINILVVDDSLAIRALLRKSLEGEQNIDSVLAASNGRTALEFFNERKPDVLILDMNMPEKNGLEVIQEIRAKKILTPVVLFSTAGQAPETLKALQYDKVDFLAKDEATGAAATNSLEENVKRLKARILPKVFQFFDFPKDSQSSNTPVSNTDTKSLLNTIAPPAPSARKKFSPLSSFRCDAVTIASSTGGPRALEEIFENIGQFVHKDFGPMFIVQHMPPVFTAQLAERLQKISGLRFKEGVNGETVQPSTIYIAPGGYHMELRSENNVVKIVLHQKELRHSVRPSADYLFETAAPIYKSKMLSFVLTGMGDDGIEGIPLVKKYLGKVVTQTAQSCAVYGMPKAVDTAGLSDGSENLQTIRQILITHFFNQKSEAA